MMALLTSRKFQAAIAAVIVVILQQLVPGLEDVDVMAVILPIIAYIFGQAFEDAAFKLKK